MNKILSASILLTGALALASCAGEEENLFDKSAAERLNETSAIYTSRLEASPGGWVMEYYPTNDEEGYGAYGYLIMSRFNRDHSVTLGMNNELSNGNYLEDTTPWEVITDNGPVLSFNAYNECIHTFSDPEAYLRGLAIGDQGTGVGGDYEFVMVDVPEGGEMIMLKGKKRGTYTRMTRVPEGTDFNSYLMDVEEFQNRIFPSNAPNFNVATFGDSIMKIAEASTSIPNFYRYNGDEIADETRHPFLITKRNGNYYLRLRDAFELKDNQKAQEFEYNEAEDIFREVNNPEFTISGPNPAEFCQFALDNAHKWQLLRSSSMSESMKEKYETVFNGFKTRGFTLSNMQFSINENGEFVLGITYRKTSNTRISVKYDFARNGDQLTISNPQPVDNAAAVISNINGLQDFVNAIATSYNASQDGSKFNLMNIKLTSASNANDWITLTFIN